MARSAVELDFFRMETETSAQPSPKKLFDRRRSFRDIQSVISKLNPEFLKTVIASGSVDQSPNISPNISKPSENGNVLAYNTFSVPSTPKHEGNPFPALPVYTPAFWNHTCGSESTTETAPLTIFFNGTVSVFNVPRHKAEHVLKMAEGGVSKPVESADPKIPVSSTDPRQLLETLDGDLPIARRKSLQRFMEKRKERLTLVSPYGSPTDNSFLGKSA
ncbi:Protein TIFY like [Actinidia chinensis var. chinensis]|uniref:Protein TIFY n=1 Tax=Actinidia chinensis var. chinensis TaxID=1590841 RepID=A0A2R6REL9_ACTCC|nr:Protein TIFY like [Actinidia chinensis var. chinensis]